MAKIIKVPEPPRSAYHPDRPLEKNPLIAAQVEHFMEAESQLPLHLRTGIDPATILTEGHASNYIRAVTRAIHRSGGRPPQKVGTAT